MEALLNIEKRRFEIMENKYAEELSKKLVGKDLTEGIDIIQKAVSSPLNTINATMNNVEIEKDNMIHVSARIWNEGYKLTEKMWEFIFEIEINPTEEEADYFFEKSKSGLENDEDYVSDISDESDEEEEKTEIILWVLRDGNCEDLLQYFSDFKSHWSIVMSDEEYYKEGILYQQQYEGRNDEVIQNNLLENKFAMHLSGILKGMGFEQGWELLNVLYEHEIIVERPIDSYFEGVDYEFRFFTSIVTDYKYGKCKERGIEEIGYCLSLNAAYDEKVKFLEDYGDYDKEWSEEELIEHFEEALEEVSYSFDFDVLEQYFVDKEMRWEVRIHDTYSYKDGNAKLWLRW